MTILPDNQLDRAAAFVHACWFPSLCVNTNELARLDDLTYIHPLSPFHSSLTDQKMCVFNAECENVNAHAPTRPSVIPVYSNCEDALTRLLRLFILCGELFCCLFLVSHDLSLVCFCFASSVSFPAACHFSGQRDGRQQ